MNDLEAQIGTYRYLTMTRSETDKLKATIKRLRKKIKELEASLANERGCGNE